MTFEATEIKSYLPCTLCGILIEDIGNSNAEPIAGSYNAIVYKQTKYQDVNGTDVCMQVLYDNTRFRTSNWLCMLLGIEVCNCCHSPNDGQASAMLIERLCYYRVC